jgi:hypothetical protein
MSQPRLQIYIALDGVFMGYKLGVTTGLHYIARSEELATTVRKLGFGLTRGTTAIEIASDVPHEVTETEGVELRHIAAKQEVEVLLHGSLTIPMCIPERSDWRDAQDHIEKSIFSAVHAGAKYVDFHACLNIWLELMTYTSRKLTMSFVDHEGHFISQILQKCAPLRDWFVEERGNLYANDILKREEISEMNRKIHDAQDKWSKNTVKEKMSAIGISDAAIGRIWTTDQVPNLVELRRGEIYRAPEERRAALIQKISQQQEKAEEILESIKKERVAVSSELQRQIINETLNEKLAKGLEWDSEELRAVVGILDGYHIMAHYMFYEKDPIWVEMAKFYPILTEKYKMDYSDSRWLHKAWKLAERDNDRLFKEFFYGTVASKFLEGHMKTALKWIDDELIPKRLAGKPKLQQNARNLILAIESPDARDPQHAGLHLLWSTRQIYVAVKVIRRELNTNKVWMLADFEHVATQGVDPIKDMEEVIRLAPDFGSICISMHANAPNPMHAHEPLELGDVRVYRLMYYMRQTGFGKAQDVYIIYERGGGEDPFMRSVESLRLMLAQLVKDTHPNKLPPEFFGYKGAVAGDERRQLQIVRDHTWEPLKDLMEMPDEEFTMLGTSALKKGKRPEQWKKAEYR